MTSEPRFDRTQIRTQTFNYTYHSTICRVPCLCNTVHTTVCVLLWFIKPFYYYLFKRDAVQFALSIDYLWLGNVHILLITNSGQFDSETALLEFSLQKSDYKSHWLVLVGIWQKWLLSLAMSGLIFGFLIVHQTGVCAWQNLTPIIYSYLYKINKKVKK